MANFSACSPLSGSVGGAHASHLSNPSSTCLKTWEKKSILTLCCSAFSEAQMTHLNLLRNPSGSADGSSCCRLPRSGGEEGRGICHVIRLPQWKHKYEPTAALGLSHFIADRWRSALHQVRLHRQQVYQDRSAKFENATSVFCQVGVGGWFHCFLTFLHAFETFVFLLAYNNNNNKNKDLRFEYNNILFL